MSYDLLVYTNVYCYCTNLYILHFFLVINFFDMSDCMYYVSGVNVNYSQCLL